MSVSEALNHVIRTLEQVEVKGRDNLNKLLGSIQTIEAVLQAMEDAQHPTAQEGEIVNE